MPCGGGYVQYERVCLYPPCKGDKFQTTSEECNAHSCQDHKLVAKGGTVTKHATEGDEHCTFPFLLHGSTYYSCIEKVLCGSACKNGKQRAPSKYKSNAICALSPNLSNDRRWGFCPQDMEGLWTQWTSWKRIKIKILYQVELLGQEFSDYVHPCDHQELKKLTPQPQAASQEESFEVDL